MIHRPYRASTPLCTRLACRIGAALLVAAFTQACSFQLPMLAQAEAEPDVMVTGSVAAGPRTEASLSDHLGPEDLRRAMGAMALALDPQGNGQPVKWDNGESGSSGRFSPSGGPFLRDDEICRSFAAQIDTAMERKTLKGMACRLSGADWRLRELSAAKPAG